MAAGYLEKTIDRGKRAMGRCGVVRAGDRTTDGAIDHPGLRRALADRPQVGTSCSRGNQSRLVDLLSPPSMEGLRFEVAARSSARRLADLP